MHSNAAQAQLGEQAIACVLMALTPLTAIYTFFFLFPSFFSLSKNK
jgi:hypothetical protein